MEGNQRWWMKESVMNKPTLNIGDDWVEIKSDSYFSTVWKLSLKKTDNIDFYNPIWTHNWDKTGTSFSGHAMGLAGTTYLQSGDSDRDPTLSMS